MKAENAFKELEFQGPESFPQIEELNIISGGCHLYGYLLTPDRRYDKPYPTVIMSHGFPGYTTNNDLELALMRMGCVVIHMNHRGRTIRRLRSSMILTQSISFSSDTVWVE